MKVHKTDGVYVLKLQKGESFVTELTTFCHDTHITNAHLVGIGAVEYVKCGYYDLANQTYLFTEYTELLEVTNVTGNIMKKADGLFVHAHGTFSNANNQVIGGHIDDMRIGVVLEIILTPLSSAITRTHDPETGLYLMDI